VETSSVNRIGLKSVGWALMTMLAIGVAGYSSMAWWSPDTIDFIRVRDGFLRQLLIAHALTGLVALAIGPFQFLPLLRNRWPVLHRNLGRVYLSVILFSGLSGLWLAFHTTGGFAATSGFFILSLVWLLTGALAWRAVLQRDFAAHRAWMMRSYALTFAAVTLRIYLGLGVAAGIPFVEIYATAAWSSWVLNLIVVEWWLLRTQSAQKVRG
jgi:uncharacterized membrane protein